jgi:hypothetical protein
VVLLTKVSVLTLRRVVEQNLGSALIFEDDVDWDIRIKAQLEQFARAANVLLQPLGTSTKDGEPSYLDPSYPSPSPGPGYHDIDINKAPKVSQPKVSPYGDNWDVLWLGHCGTKFPNEEQPQIPRGRAVILDDNTVPAKQHIKFQFGTDELVENYPPHTRVVSHTMESVCTLAYAVSQAGARKILYELGVNKLSGAFDISLRELCDKHRTSRFNCLAVQPQYFQHHRPAGHRSSFSEISGGSNDINEKAFTRNIQWSVRMHLQNLVNADMTFQDQFPDSESEVIPNDTW